MSKQEKFRNNLFRRLEKIGAAYRVNRYVELFPELDSRLVKFTEGIFRWDSQGLINLDNPDDISRIRILLRVLDETPGYDFFDNVFNEADPDNVCDILGISPANNIGEEKIEYDFTVKEINDFEDAHSYFEVVSWCIVISEESFKEYTKNGNRFFFCCNSDWRATPCVPGLGFPHDKYGYSLIAVEVTPENKIISVTGRWNTCSGESGQFLSPEELRRTLGEENFNKLFSQMLPHRTENEE